ncbi:MAG: zinc ribbon domain-containing protein [Clostridia bacterium]|nr:zinc ribbon domain-containing protein [Clostridia bacterium]
MELKREKNVCPSCGKNIRPGEQFCLHCGIQLADNAPSLPRKRKRKKSVSRMPLSLALLTAFLCVLTGIVFPYLLFKDRCDRYRSASAFYLSGDYGSASAVFRALGSFSDSEELARRAERAVLFGLEYADGIGGPDPTTRWEHALEYIPFPGQGQALTKLNAERNHILSDYFDNEFKPVFAERALALNNELPKVREPLVPEGQENESPSLVSCQVTTPTPAATPVMHAVGANATPTSTPTAAPTSAPSSTPTAAPTAAPSSTPTVVPTTVPTSTPTIALSVIPMSTPTAAPTAAPTSTPTVAPTAVPTSTPTVVPTTVPTSTPTIAPSVIPMSTPTATPTAAPTSTPTVAPTAVPTSTPTVVPTAMPTCTPLAGPATTEKSEKSAVFPDSRFPVQTASVSRGTSGTPEPEPTADPLEAAYQDAMNAFRSGLFHTAEMKFRTLGDYGKAAIMAEQCKQPFPAKGELYRRSGLAKRGSQVRIDNSENDLPVVYFVYDTADELCLKLFVPSGKEWYSKLPPGRYRLFEASGSAWYGEKELFGPEGFYLSLTDENGSDYFLMEDGFETAITTGFNDANALPTTDYSFEDFTGGIP